MLGGNARRKNSMLEFDPNFFLEETRNDFYIEPMMKCAWAAQLEVLQVVQQICEKHDIRWFVSDGTLLGAVRHHGYIPWDDDLDICMLRRDYERFLTLAPTEYTAGYHIDSPYSRPDYDMTFARIRNGSSVDYNTERLHAFHGFPYVAGVDILPLDTIPDSPDDRNAFFELYSIVFSSHRLCKEKLSEVMGILPDLEELCHTTIDRNGNIPNQLLRLADTVSQTYKNANSPYLSRVSLHDEEKQLLLKDWYADCIWLPFENIMVPAPVGYDQILTSLYGDYMTPVRGTAAHDYPFYAKQRKEIVEQLTDCICKGENPFVSSHNS